MSRPAKVMLLLMGVLLIMKSCYADIYMHNPRGSNDRNCERDVNRQNGARLFDSQNNAKGGYACPRAVGDETIQTEDGVASFGTFTQSKRMYFYEGSILPIEWTQQHGCGQNSQVNCEIILQYQCEDIADPMVNNFWPYTEGKNNQKNKGQQRFRSGSNIGAPRDGIPRDSNDAATDTISDDEASAIPSTVETRRFGMQESYDYYQLCQRTEGNKGLYTADQRVRRNDQRGTRQNPNGNRQGFECPEERDYYPWWHPSPWIDIAVLTNEAGPQPCSYPTTCTTQRCRYYLSNSFNRATKGYCDIPHDSTSSITTKTSSRAWQQNQWYNNRAACESNGFVWYEVSLKDNVTGLPYPTCRKAQFGRVNHLGNAFDDSVTFNASSHVHDFAANRFLWKIPTIPAAKSTTNYFSQGMQSAYQSCVLRVRYNVTTSDYPVWPSAAMESTHPWNGKMVDYRNNSKTQNDPNTPLKQNPYVYIGAGDSVDAGSQFVSLRVNTNQIARTFQDRSYKFTIKKRPSSTVQANDQTDAPYTPAVSSSKLILNVNVRGKRGNIVQTYPAVEYNFSPDRIAADPNTYLHIQWTGSDYNPRRGCNDANGGPPDPNDFISSANADQNSRADRSNMVLIDSLARTIPTDLLGIKQSTFDGTAYTTKEINAIDMTLSKAPCYQYSSTITSAPAAGSTATICYDQMVKLAYLNQQSDEGSLQLRRQKNCLTQDELNALSSQDVQRNHPLNCANINAKPYPYYDAGLVKLVRPGKYVFSSTRNNNFSNRDQKIVICVTGTDPLTHVYYNCSETPGPNVMEDMNPAASTLTQQVLSTRDFLVSQCYNSQGSSEAYTNCQSLAKLLSGETLHTFGQDNDNYGDGDAFACRKLSFKLPFVTKVEKQVAMAVGLLFFGIVVVWGGVFAYNRYRARHPRTGGTTTASTTVASRWQTDNHAEMW